MPTWIPACNSAALLRNLSVSALCLFLFSCLECETHRPPATKNVTLTACHAPVRDRTRVVSVSGMAGLAVAALAFILRIVARFRCCGGQFGWDDGTMVFTMVRFNINAGMRNPRPNSAQLLVVPLSAFSVVCMFSLAPLVVFYETNIIFSGRFRTRKRYVDAPIR